MSKCTSSISNLTARLLLGREGDGASDLQVVCLCVNIWVCAMCFYKNACCVNAFTRLYVHVYMCVSVHLFIHTSMHRMYRMHGSGKGVHAREMPTYACMLG